MIDYDLKLEIVRQRVEEGRTITELSKKYGVSVGSISRWTNDYKNSEALRKRISSTKDRDVEIERLRKENERLRIEVDVYKDLLKSIAQGAKQVDADGEIK